MNVNYRIGCYITENYHCRKKMSVSQKGKKRREYNKKRRTKENAAIGSYKKELTIRQMSGQQTVLDNEPTSTLADTQYSAQQLPGNDVSGHMGQTGGKSSSSNHLFGRPTKEPPNSNHHHCRKKMSVSQKVKKRREYNKKRRTKENAAIGSYQKELTIRQMSDQQTVLDNVPASNSADTQYSAQQRPGNDAGGHMGQTGGESSSSNHLFGRPTRESPNSNHHHPYSMSSLPNIFHHGLGSSMPQYRDNRDMVHAYHGLDNQLRHNLQSMQHLHHRHAAPSAHVHHNLTHIPQHNAPTFHPHTSHQTTNTHLINSHFIPKPHTIPPNNFQQRSLHHHHYNNMHAHVRQYVPSQFHPLTTHSTTNTQLVMSHPTKQPSTLPPNHFVHQHSSEFNATQANPESNAHFIPALNLPDEDEEIYTLETPLVDQHVVTQARIPTLNLPGDDIKNSNKKRASY